MSKITLTNLMETQLKLLYHYVPKFHLLIFKTNSLQVRKIFTNFTKEKKNNNLSYNKGKKIYQ
jgi:hypothetical protein